MSNSNVWSFYTTATGILTGRTYSGPVADLAANTPAGCSAVPGDGYDPMSQKVFPGTTTVVDYQPPAPAADANQTWSWNATTKRWVSVPTPLAALAAARTSYSAMASDMLDKKAQAWGYDNMVAAASYATSTNAQYKAESVALIEWRDSVWSTADSLFKQVAAGTIPLPQNAMSFVEMLPKAPIRPMTT